MCRGAEEGRWGGAGRDMRMFACSKDTVLESHLTCVPTFAIALVAAAMPEPSAIDEGSKRGNNM